MDFKKLVSLNEENEFTFPANLPIWHNYAYNQISSIVSSTTMEVHARKHHQGYIDKLNILLNEYNDGIFSETTNALDVINTCNNFSKELNQQQSYKLSKIMSKIKFLAGGHLNHTLYWKLLTVETTSPSESFLMMIDEAFGSYEHMQDKCIEELNSIQGSGWLWLVQNPSNHKLMWLSTPNHDIPESHYRVALVLDAWEHAYYLDYMNNKDVHIKNIFSIVDWCSVEGIFAQDILKLS